jgi:hypothetical protein
VCGAPGELFQDAADQTRLGDEGDHAHDASAAGTDERIDLVDPSDELGPSAAQGGQSWGRWPRSYGADKDIQLISVAFSATNWKFRDEGP